MKTPESQRFMCIDREMADVFQRWRQRTQFSAPEDWMFASPYQMDACRTPMQGSGGRSAEQRPRPALGTLARMRSAYEPIVA